MAAVGCAAFTLTASETTELTAFDGLRLHGIRWRAPGKAKACVIVVHGVGEHSGRYAHMADYLTQHGYTVYSLDYRGHGLSEGERANIGSFDAAAEDIKTCYDWLASEEHDTPVFIFGHSQGTLVTLFFVLKYPQLLRGVMLSATMLGLSKVAKPLAWLASTLNRVSPEARLFAIEPSTISRDPEVLRAAENDPLISRTRLTPRIIHAMIYESRHVLEQLPSLNLPFLIMHGTADRLVPPVGSQLIYDAVSNPDKTLKWYDGLYHEICNEPEQEQVFADIVSWLDDHQT
jgi:alpha-beta hydrolase superfamily lysophospholipase